MGENVARAVYAIEEGDEVFIFFPITSRLLACLYYFILFLIHRRADLIKILICIKQFRDI